MTDIVARACVSLAIEQDQVVKHRLEGDELVLLVDRGIGGITKHRIAVATLPPDLAPVLDELTYVELRDMAKEQGIPYGGKRKAELIEALETLDEEE